MDPKTIIKSYFFTRYQVLIIMHPRNRRLNAGERSRPTQPSPAPAQNEKYFPHSTTLPIRDILIEQLFFQIFLLCLKQEKQERQETFPKFGNFNRGQNIWKAPHSNIWKKKSENMEIQKTPRFFFWKIQTKISSIRTALSIETPKVGTSEKRLITSPTNSLVGD